MINTATPTAIPYRRAAAAMGTVFSVHLHDAGEPAHDHRGAARAVDAFFEEVERLEAMFSTFRVDSAISRINRGEIAPAECAAEVCDVLDACHLLDRATGGAFCAFRPEPPYDLDPSGFVKGWAAERATHVLTDAGFRHWCVNAGGDVVMSARPSHTPNWRVGISDPRDPHVVRATVELASGAVATSGTSARGMHLWNGRTAARVQPFASFTVIGPNLTWADAFATAGYALGADGIDWVASFEGFEALAIRHDGTIARSR